MTTIDDVIRLLEAAKSETGHSEKKSKGSLQKKKPKRKASAYSKRYGKAFKKLAPKYKKKNGQWKKDGFKRCAAAARRVAKK
tara:strand:+ start:703 stop:948 length:246 start_codon:yes stop_codon:yes gene_type:complete